MNAKRGPLYGFVCFEVLLAVQQRTGGLSHPFVIVSSTLK